MCLQIISLIYMYNEDLILDYLQWMLFHKTQPNKPILHTPRKYACAHTQTTILSWYIQYNLLIVYCTQNSKFTIKNNCKILINF